MGEKGLVKWKIAGLILVFLLWVGAIYFSLKKVNKPKYENSANILTTITPMRINAQVVKVIDGDTIKISTGERVRYIGIDTPAIATKPGELDDCFAKEASEANRRLVEGRQIELEKDLSEVDRYGRLLRYVYVRDDYGKIIQVNQALISEGYARLFILRPDVKYKSLYQEAENEAKSNKIGLWQACQNSN